MILYFVVKTADGYDIWEMTADELYARTESDSALEARLDRHPFKTRIEAEQRRKALLGN